MLERGRLLPAKRTSAKRRTPAALLARLAKAYPDWGPTLEFSNAFELLVATILAAQARDEHINQVTRTLFKKYRRPEDYIRADISELEQDVHQTGFFRQKARALKSVSEGLVEMYGGQVPGTVDELVTLKGVGRKTASLVAANAFGIPAVAVDRHVARVAGRLGLSKSGDPDVIEEDLRASFPKKDWVKATWLFVLHGRRTCTPTPSCPVCPVLDLCPYPKKTKAPKVTTASR